MHTSHRRLFEGIPAAGMTYAFDILTSTQSQSVQYELYTICPFGTIQLVTDTFMLENLIFFPFQKIAICIGLSSFAKYNGKNEISILIFF